MKDEELRELVLSLLEYVPDTGTFTWKHRMSSSALGGSQAGNILKTGYVHIKIRGKNYYAHRLVFLMERGYTPKYVDHINGDKGDNRQCNLRESSNSQNGANSFLRNNNTSGYKGVTFDKINKKWKASIGVKGKNIPLGRFKVIEEAAEAYDKEALAQFGEYAKTNKMLGLL